MVFTYYEDSLSISSLGSIIISRKTYKLSFVNRRKFSSFILHIRRFFSDYRKCVGCDWMLRISAN